MIKKESPLRRAVHALSLASPFCMIPRTKGDFAHCVEVSVVGAAALVDRTFDARVVPCGIIGMHSKLETGVSVGLTAREVYDLTTGEKPSFEEWKLKYHQEYNREFWDYESPSHVVIEARCGNERTIVDLTLGQIRQKYRIDVSLTRSWFMSRDMLGWPQLETPIGWQISYVDCPRADTVSKQASEYPIPRVWVEELDYLMDLAIGCGLDQQRFYRELNRQQPKLFKLCLKHLESVVGIAAEEV